MLVRKVLAQGFAEQTLGTALTQTFQVHLPESASGSVAGSTASVTSTPDITASAPTCTHNTDNSVDCATTVTVTPSAAGNRSATLTVALPQGNWQNPLANIALNGTVTGSVLTLDSASTTISGNTTPLLPTTNSLFSSIAPVGVALDGAGNVYTINANSGTIQESVHGASGVAISSSVPSNPGQIAVDALGDVFAVGSGTPTIQELKVAGGPASAGAPASFVAGSVSYAPGSASTAAPLAIAVDGAGNLFVADYQGSPAANAVYRISLEPNTLQSQVTIATGFTNPVSLAVDGSANVYVAWTKGPDAVLQARADERDGTYAQSNALLSNVLPLGVAVDAAGDVYVEDQNSGSVLEVPVSGPQTVTVFSGLSALNGVCR